MTFLPTGHPSAREIKNLYKASCLKKPHVCSLYYVGVMSRGGSKREVGEAVCHGADTLCLHWVLEPHLHKAYWLAPVLHHPGYLDPLKSPGRNYGRL